MKKIHIVLFLLLVGCSTTHSYTEPTGVGVSTEIAESETVQYFEAPVIQEPLFPAEVVSPEIPFAESPWQNSVAVWDGAGHAAVMVPSAPGLMNLVGYDPVSQNRQQLEYEVPERLYLRRFQHEYVLDGYTIPTGSYIVTIDSWAQKESWIFFNPQQPALPDTSAGLFCVAEYCDPIYYVAVPMFFYDWVSHPIVEDRPYCHVKESAVFIDPYDWSVNMHIPHEGLQFWIASSGMLSTVMGIGGLLEVQESVVWERLTDDPPTYKASWGANYISVTDPLHALVGSPAGDFCNSSGCTTIYYGALGDETIGRPINWMSPREAKYHWCD